MEYEAILSQVVALLQREGRIAYRVLKRRLQLDDDLLEDLKDDLIYAKKLANDEEGKVLMWAGTQAEPSRPRASSLNRAGIRLSQSPIAGARATT